MWVGHQFTQCLIPAYIGRRTCIYHIYSLGVDYTIGVCWSVNISYIHSVSYRHVLIGEHFTCWSVNISYIFTRCHTGVCWSANISHMFPRHLICGSSPIYIRIRHLIGWPADHFTYISSVFDMLISNHLHTHSAFNMLASKRVFDIRYYNVDLQTCPHTVLGSDYFIVF